MSKIMELGGTASAGTISGEASGLNSLGYYDVDREGNGYVPLFPPGHDARHEVEAVFFVRWSGLFPGPLP